jgi:hypothetical protein
MGLPAMFDQGVAGESLPTAPNDFFSKQIHIFKSQYTIITHHNIVLIPIHLRKLSFCY